MTGMRHKPAVGVYLSATLPDGDAEALREYQENPFVFQMVELYAREHDVSVEDVLYGRRGVQVEAPRLGYSTIGEAARGQKELIRSLKGPNR